ncbi:MAG: AsmA family protein [Candidatus Omnitrophota bacterium]
MKKAAIVSLTLLIAIFFAGIVKDRILQSAVTIIATQFTGTSVHIDGFSLGLFSRSVRISGFKVYNPKGFSKTILADLSKINISYDLGALFRKKLHLPRLEIEIKEIGLEKNKKGQLNIDELRIVKEGKNQESGPSGKMPLHIDMLTLSIGRIVLKDYGPRGEPAIKVYDINTRKSYKNIPNAQQLAVLILAEPMKAAGIQGAKIYGVTMLAGVTVLPVAVAMTLIGRDSVQQDFTSSFDNAYKESLRLLEQKGRVTKKDKSQGIISATINSAQITAKIKEIAGGKTRVIVSARKYLFPKLEIAGGILYEIAEKLK